MAHTIKIEDKLYDRVKEYCTLNDISVQKFCNDAVSEHLNMEMFGDAPFMVQSVVLKANEIDINGKVYTKEALEKMINKKQAAEDISEVLTDKVNELSKEDKYHDEDGKLIITPVSAEDGEKQLIEFLSTHTYDEFVKKEEPKEEVKPKRPGKRRL